MKGKFKALITSIIIFLILITIGVLISWKTGIFKKMFTPKPGSCLILTESNCRKVKIVEVNGHKIAKANLSKGTILFSPISGLYDNALIIHTLGDLNKNNWDFGSTVIINNTEYDFIYSKKDERKVSADGTIKKGEQIGVVNDTSLKKDKGFNLVLDIIQRDKDGKIMTSDDSLLKLFKNK